MKDETLNAIIKAITEELHLLNRVGLKSCKKVVYVSTYTWLKWVKYNRVRHFDMTNKNIQYTIRDCLILVDKKLIKPYEIRVWRRK